MAILNKTIEADALDWIENFLWVADNCVIRRQDGQSWPDSGVVMLVRNDGKTISIDRERLERDYICIEPNQAWKPKYRPFKANSIASPALVKTPQGQSFEVEAGGAVLRDDDGRYFGLGQREYARCYEVVGRPGSAKPIAPFQPQG